jgi:hypothetical protein
MATRTSGSAMREFAGQHFNGVNPDLGFILAMDGMEM